MGWSSGGKAGLRQGPSLISPEVLGFKESQRFGQQGSSDSPQPGTVPAGLQSSSAQHVSPVGTTTQTSMGGMPSASKPTSLLTSKLRGKQIGQSPLRKVSTPTAAVCAAALWEASFLASCTDQGLGRENVWLAASGRGFTSKKPVCWECQTSAALRLPDDDGHAKSAISFRTAQPPRVQHILHLQACGCAA